MKDREAVVGFHYAERSKAQFLLVHRLLEVMGKLSGEEARGGRAVVLACIDGIRGDLLAGRSQFPHIQWERALQWIQRLRDETERGDIQAALQALSRCVSSVTTISHLTMEVLLARGIL